jgi:hypothetical protein
MNLGFLLLLRPGIPVLGPEHHRSRGQLVPHLKAIILFKQTLNLLAYVNFPCYLISEDRLFGFSCTLYHFSVETVYLRLAYRSIA